MVVQNMAFTPATGLRDASFAPTDPVSEAAIRDVIQKVPDQLRDYINGTLLATLHSTTLGSSGSEEVASPTIAGLTGNTVYAQIANMLAVAQAAQAGTILPGTVTDDKLSNTAGQIKDTVTTHFADSVKHITAAERTAWNAKVDLGTVNSKSVGSTLYAYNNLGGAL